MREEAVQVARYPTAIRLLHWLMAAGFMFMWGSGLALGGMLPDGSPLEDTLMELHISSGVTLLFLLLARLVIRLISPLPGDLPDTTALQRKLAHLGHFALYALPFTVMLIGWAETDFGGWGVSWFGVEMPKLFPTMETWAGINLEETTETLHELLAWLMLAVVVGHVAAFIKHRRAGHDLLPRISLR